MSDMDQVLQDFAAFADDDADVAIDHDGTIVYSRDAQEHQVQIASRPDGLLEVLTEGGARVPYRDYLARDLGRLDVLAERLLTRRAAVPGGFISTGAQLDRAGEGRRLGRSSELLDDECRTAPPFAVRLTFLTADAGHGKSALLRHYQHEVAEAFLHRRSPFLFWHVDLQGRQLLRLSEALMGDLGDLRVSGLWVAGIHRLVRSGALVLAIDGFDELAAEQGSSDALGALASLIRELDNHGTIIAASRRAFFDSQDYLQRAGTFRRVMPQSCQFNQLELLPWTESEGLAYFERVEIAGRTFESPNESYAGLRSALGHDQNHPILTRPFLLYQAARALLEYGLTPHDFVSSMDDPLRGVASVVQAFVDREVMEKWRNRETGEPYLDSGQHMAILGDVAEEMYRAGRDRVALDVVETVVAIRLDEWGIAADRRQQIMAMVRVHALLRPPMDGDDRQRAFDHPEFRDYFIAEALKERLEGAADAEASRLVDFLTMAPLPDGTAKYVLGLIQVDDGGIRTIATALCDAANRHVKTTHLQANSGTLIPQLLTGLHSGDAIELDTSSIAFVSLALRGSRLKDLRLNGGQFLNVLLQDVQWENLTLAGVQLGEITIDRASSAFRDVKLIGELPTGIRLIDSGEEVERAYAPAHVRRLLESVGFLVEADDEARMPSLPFEDTTTIKHFRRLLTHFYRSTVITSYDIDRRFRKVDYDPAPLVEALERHGVLLKETWKGAGQAQVWRLACGIEDLLRAEGGSGDRSLVSLWDELRSW